MKKKAATRENTGKSSRWKKMKLSSRISVITGFLSILILAAVSISIIHMGKNALYKSLQGNMNDKIRLGIADLDNVVTQAETTANTIKDGMIYIYDQTDLSGGVPANPPESLIPRFPRVVTMRKPPYWIPFIPPSKIMSLSWAPVSSWNRMPFTRELTNMLPI